MERLFEVSDIIPQCRTCGQYVDDDADFRGHGHYCVECYVNPYCLAGCTGEHDESSWVNGPDGNGQFYCVESDTHWTYTGPSDEYSNETYWTETDSWTHSVDLDGYWYNQDDVCSCSDCGVNIHCDDAYSNDDYELMCSPCYEADWQRRQEERYAEEQEYDDICGLDEDDDPDDIDRDYNRRNGGRIATTPMCATCSGSVLTYYHVHTEDVFCTPCAATKMAEGDTQIKLIAAPAMEIIEEWELVG